MPSSVDSSEKSQLRSVLQTSLNAAVGAVFAAFTVTVIMAWPTRLPVSVTDAVIVCSPMLRVEVMKVFPVPIFSASRLEVHTSAVVRSPSSASSAVPVNMIESPSVVVQPSVGETIVAVGGVFATPGTVTLRVSSDTPPSLSTAISTTV